PWPANTRTGRRSISGASCSRKTWTPPTRGSSRTSGWCDSVADRDDRERGCAARQRHADLIVDALAEQAPPERRVPAAGLVWHVDLVGPDDSIPRERPFRVDLHPGAEKYALRIAPAGRRARIDHGHALEPLAQKAHPAVDLMQALLAIGVLGILGAVPLCR